MILLVWAGRVIALSVAEVVERAVVVMEKVERAGWRRVRRGSRRVRRGLERLGGGFWGVGVLL
jgi:hypothetical protein